MYSKAMCSEYAVLFPWVERAEPDAAFLQKHLWILHFCRPASWRRSLGRGAPEFRANLAALPFVARKGSLKRLRKFPVVL